MLTFLSKYGPPHYLIKLSGTYSLMHLVYQLTHIIMQQGCSDAPLLPFETKSCKN